MSAVRTDRCADITRRGNKARIGEERSAILSPDVHLRAPFSIENTLGGGVFSELPDHTVCGLSCGVPTG
jgi:hypothetical protein